MTAQERQLVDHLILELQGEHAEFRRSISPRFVGLTEYDLRLCVLLQANLSTKEIAILLNITPDSVKKAKHRLRKKMSLNPEISWGTAFEL